MKTTALLLLLCASSFGQSKTTGTAETKGACSPANTGDKNTFYIRCGIDKEQGQKMLAILNTILSKQLDPNAVMTKLDEISSSVQDIQRRTGDRSLTDSQVTALSRALRSSPQSISVMLIQDREASAYGQQIVQVFQSAGWDIQLNVSGMMTPPRYGIVVSGNEALLRAFAAAGIDASRGNERATLVIGLKPY